MIDADDFAFAGINVYEIGREGQDGQMWATIKVVLKDATIDHHPSVHVLVPLKRDRDATLGDIEEAARAYALRAMRSAISVLDGATVQALAQRQAAEAAAEEASWAVVPDDPQ